MQNTEYLIIGQGLAGTLFAHELEKNGHDFRVIAPDTHNASKTAAGMYNPVVLKRFSPVWQAREQIQTARQTLQRLEKQLGETLDYALPIYRIFHDEAECKTWQEKATLPELSDLLDSEICEVVNDNITAPDGLGKVNLGGRADIKALLTAYRHHLVGQGRLFSEAVDYDQLTVTANGVQYGDILAQKVVCCEGYGIKQNPFFKDLPLKGNKGEVLTVKIPHLDLTAAVKSNVFIMPLPEQGDDVYFVGATYHWTEKDEIPTSAARETLLKKLSQFVTGNIEVLTHTAGLRPTVIDRRPLLGQHSVHKRLYILNGLGTRGVMLGATMAPLLYRFIENGIALPDEVNIQRFSEV